MTSKSETVHGTAVASRGRGLLITGEPGAGKSTLALELIALGADLVSDDRVEVFTHGDALGLRPTGAPGLIEARGVGLIELPHAGTAALNYWVDLDLPATERLPTAPYRDLLGHKVPVILGKGRGGLAAILWVLLSRGRLADPDAPLA